MVVDCQQEQEQEQEGREKKEERGDGRGKGGCECGVGENLDHAGRTPSSTCSCHLFWTTVAVVQVQCTSDRILRPQGFQIVQASDASHAMIPINSP